MKIKKTFECTVRPVCNDHHGTPKKCTLFEGSRCSEGIVGKLMKRLQF